MTDLVQLTKDNGIAVITINNPPVNALSPGVPEGISEALDQIAQDDSVKAVVLIGGGRTFVGGADIKEFGKRAPGKPRGAGLLPLLLKIEDSTKPVIVAIHGTAFGGGLELAMAGLCSGAVSTADAGQNPCRFPPAAVIDAVEAATKMSFEEGCKLEQKLFMDCLFSQQSKALIHVFLSEREVSKIPNIPKDTPVLPIRSVGVIGAGTMGGGIAMVLANAGI